MEDKTSILYKTLAEKIDLPFVKSLMLAISQDSQKHSIILKGVSESLTKEAAKAKECAKNSGAPWHAIEELQKEIAKKQTIVDLDLLELSERLVVLESSVGEEYYVFVQLKTLELLVNQINRNYDVDLASLRTMFTRIIDDEEYHRELIEKARAILERRREKPQVAPFVKYQNIDAWISPTE